MATTPAARPRASDSPLDPMQEPLGSMDRPDPDASDIGDVNLPPGETVRRSGSLGATDAPGPGTGPGGGRSFTGTFAVAAVVLLVAFLLAIYLGSNRSEVATAPPGTQAPVADTNAGDAANDQTGSTTVAPAQQPAPAAGTGVTGGAPAAPANP